MKRFTLFIAMVGLLATSCQKTIVKNEMETPISFATESGKQTRAIVQDETYLETQPFGVFAYGHQGNATPTTVMNNVEVSCSASVWKATSGSYYWPHDPNTTLDFYAYSPYTGTDGTATGDDQKLTVTPTHSEAEGLKLTGYKHTNMYVDFMVAAPVRGATYTNPDGVESTTGSAGVVPVVFAHEMTQVLFEVYTDKAYEGVTFTVNSIQLEGICNEADYSYEDKWSGQSAFGTTFKVFPAGEEGATPITNEPHLKTTPVTMIPQNIKVDTQKFTINYSISGEGVATETVTKTLELESDALVSGGQQPMDGTVYWEPNTRITYKVVIGLREITFTPSVAVWEDVEGTTVIN